MPLQKDADDPIAHWIDDDVLSVDELWDDDLSEIYLRAEEVWPDGKTIRDLALLPPDGVLRDYPEDAGHDPDK